MSVDLPAPFRPSNPYIPCGIDSVTLSRALTPSLLGHREKLCGDANDLPMLYSIDRAQRVRHQWQQVFKRITRAAQRDDSQFPRC